MRIDAVLQDSAKQEERADTSRWLPLIERLVDECPPDQRAAILDDATYVALIAGRGAGKTHVVIVRFLRRMIRRTGARCFYVAKTRDHAKDVIWADLRKLIRKIGFVEDVDVVYNETRLTMTFTCNGSTLKLVGADKQHDIDKLRGPTYAEIGIDEMGAQLDKVVRYLIEEVVGPRLVGTMCLAGTAGKQPIGLWHEITGPKSAVGRMYSERNSEPELLWSVHRWSLESAIEATRDRPIPLLLELFETQKKYIAKNGWSDDNPKKRREIDAEWVQDATESIYQYKMELCRWDPPRIGPLQLAKLPDEFKEWVHIIAIDLGSSDPTSISVFATALDDKSCTIYHRYTYEQKALYSKTIAQLLLGEHLDHSQPGGIIGALGRWPNGMCADHVHLGQAILDELSDVYGIAIDPVVKGWHYKLGAIEVLKGDFHEGRFKVLKDSELERQLMRLQWSLSPRGELIEPRGPRNDAADTAVYGRQLIAEFMTARGEAPPVEAESGETTEPARARGVMVEQERNLYEECYYDD